MRLVFFGNYFYGICAIGLSIESSLQQKLAVPHFIFLILAFSATLLFYTRAYIKTEVSDDTNNLRSLWYANNRKMMQRTQFLFLLLLTGLSLYFYKLHASTILAFHFSEWLILLIFPLVSAFYYGIDSDRYGKHNLRNVGWLKPLIIGFSWAGMVTVYPVLFYAIEQNSHYHLNVIAGFLFLKNFVFVTILSVLFDIKDYAMDYNVELKTWIVKLGPRKTIYYIIIPLCIVSLCSYLIFANLQHFSEMKMLINAIPFIATIIVAYSMHLRRSIFYYLMVVDGLMLLKAICGTVAMLYF